MRTIHNCNVAVVGGAGFLGSHLVEHLVKDRGCIVLVIDNLEVGRLDWVKGVQFIHHDITGSENYLTKLLQGIKYVFNYAARPYVPDSYDRPLRTFDVNAMGALKVINAAETAGCEGILQVSSAEVYGNCYAAKDIKKDEVLNRAVRLSEDAVISPHSSYGASKAAIDALCQVRWKESKTPVIALRQFNCIGERETHPYVVPEIISQIQALLAGCPPEVMGIFAKAVHPTVHLGNNSFRDFMYAGDAVRIAVELLERGQFGEVYNLGSESGIKVYDLAKLIGKVMGVGEVTVVEDASRKRPWEIWHLQSDNSKIGSLGVRGAFVPLEDALSKTYGWFKDNGCRWPWEVE